MPYIPQDARIQAEKQPGIPGELNFALTQLIKFYLGEEPNYQRYNDVLGALEGAKLELYRRKIAGYEDSKIIENGDVYV
jgi:hypothetical protein